MPLYHLPGGDERVQVPAGSSEDVRMSSDGSPWALVPDDAPAEPAAPDVDDAPQAETAETAAQRRTRLRAERDTTQAVDAPDPSES